jgi:hypothetical protein
LDGGFFQRAVPPLDLPVRAGVSWFGEAMLDALLGADPLEARPTRQHLVGLRRELYALIGPYLGYSSLRWLAT